MNLDVEHELRDRDSMLQLLRFHLYRAQHRMVQMANKKRSDRSFEVGVWVFVKLQPYRQVSAREMGSKKLKPLYYGPYCSLDKIEKVAYRLQLPESAQIHSTFHVSKLKKYMKEGQVASTKIPSFKIRDQVP